MAYTNTELRKAYLRARMTKLKLAEEIASGATARRIAELSERYERQKAEHHALRDANMKL